MDWTFVIFVLCGFLAVVLLLEGAVNLWASKRGAQAVRIKSRLDMLSGEAQREVTLEREKENQRLPWLNQLLKRASFGDRLSAHVRASGMDVSPGELLILSAILGLVGMGLVLVFQRPVVMGLAIGAMLAAVPWWRVSAARSARVKRFEMLFPEALDLMGRAMRAGHSFPSAVRMCGDEMSEPMGRDFRILSDEMNYGVPTGEALQSLCDRVPLPDVTYFAVAVMIQRESGGNLAELLDNISSIVRARLKLLGEVRTLSAEGKLSAWVLIALPFVTALTLNLINPEFMSVLWTDPAGMRMIGIALCLMVAGVFWMRKIVNIRV